MANDRDRPYLQFNFEVKFASDCEAGFQEVSGIGTEVTVAEYRNGNYGLNNVQKLTGLNKATDITLKRGIMNSVSFYKMIDKVRNGQDVKGQIVDITLKDESNSPVLTWELSGARITKYTSGPLNAKGTDVAMEEMVLAYERISVSKP